LHNVIITTTIAMTVVDSCMINTATSKCRRTMLEAWVMWFDVYLEITMHNVHVVQIIDGTHHLGYQQSSISLGVGTQLDNLVE
jgi:hypothetical protein